MKHYNKKIEVIRVFKHFVLEWEDADEAKKDKGLAYGGSTLGFAPKYPAHSGTEIYDDKEDLLARIGQLL